jgi:hypothetical protein
VSWDRKQQNSTVLDSAVEEGGGESAMGREREEERRGERTIDRMTSNQPISPTPPSSQSILMIC